LNSAAKLTRCGR
jgi:hypothetical protein